MNSTPPDPPDQPTTETKRKRPYRADVRRARAAQTRARILEGLARTMARGITEVSVPAVARAAGVSVPTVYRHFPTKRALVEALPGYFVERLGVQLTGPPGDLAEMGGLLREMYGQVEGLDETLKVAAVSPLARDIRRAYLPQRLAAIEQMLAPYTAGLDESERLRLRNVALVLSTSAMVRAFDEYLALSGAEAAEHITWAIHTLARGAATLASGTAEEERSHERSGRTGGEQGSGGGR